MTIKKSWEIAPVKTILLSLLLILAVNYLAGFFYFRLDLTAEKRFTLNQTTIDLLDSLDKPVAIKIYLEGDQLPPRFRHLRKGIGELLDELKLKAGKKISYRFVNPTSSEKKEDRFEVYHYLMQLGIRPFETQEQSAESSSRIMLFPSAVVVYGDHEIGVNLLQSTATSQPDSEENINKSIQALEYEFTNAIRKLATDIPKKVAFIEGHGELSEFEVADFATQLSEYYEVQRGALTGQLNAINHFDALIVAKPEREFSVEDKYILDQYIMRGGKVLFLLDGAQVSMDSLETQSYTLVLGHLVNLEDMLFSYGIRVNPDLVEDVQCSRIGLATAGHDGNPQIEWFPWTYFPLIVSRSQHSISQNIDVIKTEFMSTIDTVNNGSSIKKTVILETSQSSKITGLPIRVSFDRVNHPIDKAQFRHNPLPIAVLLEGKFPSIFSNRPNPMQESGHSTINESDSTAIIVISDGDLARNIVSPDGQPYPLGFDRYSKRTFKGNTQLLVNSVNYLVGDADYLAIRNRNIALRLLDKEKVARERVFWQTVNLLAPVLLVLLFGLITFVIRKQKYGS